MTQPRSPKPSIKFVDEPKCNLQKHLYQKSGVRENFQDLHLGIISEIKRKSLPEIALVVGLENQQSLHHFLTKSHPVNRIIKEAKIRINPASIK